MGTVEDPVASNLKPLSDALARLVPNIGGLTQWMRATAPLVRRNWPGAETDPRLASLHAGALELYRTELLPALKETRREIDALIASIEGTWKPPTN